MIDFHSHVLPGIDDGSKSLEESIAMLRLAAKQGIRHMVATPHFYPQHDDPERFLRRRAEAERALRNEMRKHEGLPGLRVGAEVYYFRGMSESEIISRFTIEGTRCILIEMPGPPWTDSMYQELENLHSRRGLIPVVAHIDRYIGRFHTHGIPRKLAKLPVLVQANADFFLDRSTSSMAMRMLKQDAIHLLGSDCHNMASRKPNLEAAMNLIQKRLGDEPLKAVNAFSRRILANNTNSS